MTTYVVSPGFTSTGIVLNNGDSMFVDQFGSAISTTANGGSEVSVASGGTAISTTVNAFAAVQVAFGGFVSATILTGNSTSSAFEGVSGSARGDVIKDFGVVRVFSGGIAENETLSGTATMTVDVGATASLTMNSGGFLTVAGSAVGGSVSSQGQDEINASGSATDITATDHSLVDVNSGGLAISTTLSGSVQVVFLGTASNTLIFDGGVEDTVSGTSVDAIVNSGGKEIADGAVAVVSNVTVNDGGTLQIKNAANVPGMTINTDATVELTATPFTGFTAGTAITLLVDTFSIATDTVLNGGFETVSFFGASIGTTVNGAGIETAGSGGTTSSATIEAAGFLKVSAGGSALDVTIANGGNGTVFAGGTADGTNVDGGTLTVSSGGTASGTNLDGSESVLAGGVDSSATVDGGGHLSVESGGTVKGAEVGGILVVSLGGTASGTYLETLGIEDVFGRDDGATVVGELNVSSGGSATNATVNAIGRVTVFAGGTADGTNVDGGTLTVSSGGTASGTNLDGSESVLAGGVDSSATVDGGGHLSVESGGTVRGAEVGGILVVSLGGTASGTYLETLGIEDVFGRDDGATVVDELNVSSGGSATNATVNAIGRVTVYDGGRLGGTVVDDGTIQLAPSGTDTFSATLTGSGSLVDEGGGTLVLAAGGGFSGLVQLGGGTVELTSSTAAGTGKIQFAAAATLKIDGATMPLNHISGFAPGDVIDLAGIGFTTGDSATVSGGILTLTSGTTTLAALNLPDLADGTALHAGSDGGTGTDISIACFCRGTLISTEAGDVPVEELAVGDRVRTLSGASKPIVWIGLGRDLVTRANKLARPIIVRAGALADGVPHRDLHLTHGHALYLDGVLIPVENLVNHRSILWDETARVVEYYHIELENHDAVFAEGAAAETYYDASNRARFHNTRPGSASGGEKAPFAPVLSGGELVEGVWRRLFARADGEIASDTTDDPDLHLLVDGGRLDPAAAEGCTYAFSLTMPPADALAICSRSGVPSLLGIGAHDHRQLGVALTGIELRQPGVATTFEHDAALFVDAGCHPAESDYVWNDGVLELPAHLFVHLTGAFTLTMRIERPGMRYPLQPMTIKAAA